MNSRRRWGMCFGVILCALFLWFVGAKLTYHAKKERIIWLGDRFSELCEKRASEAEFRAVLGQPTTERATDSEITIEYSPGILGGRVQPSAIALFSVKDRALLDCGYRTIN